MAVVLPGPSPTLTASLEGADTVYYVFGPLSPGLWLRRTRCFWNMSGAGTMLFGWSMSGASQASGEALAGGKTLIRTGVIGLSGLPIFTVVADALDQGWYEVPVGSEIVTGAQFIHVGVRVTTAVTGRFLFSAETFNVRRVVEEGGALV